MPGVTRVSSTMPPEIVLATSVDRNAPTTFSTPLIRTATFGRSAPVAMDVAIAFAVSWKPLVKSKASAVTMTTATRNVMWSIPRWKQSQLYTRLTGGKARVWACKGEHLFAVVSVQVGLLPRGRSGQPSLGISIAGQRSMTMSRPAARVRSYAASSITPSWYQTALAPRAAASSATVPARSLLTNTSTTSTSKGIASRDGVPLFAVDRLGLRVDGHDALAEALEDVGDAVRRAPLVRRQAHDRPGVAVLREDLADRC